jgi:hypothetical protein
MWFILSSYYLCMQIFKDATLFFSRDGTPSIASVIPVMDHLDEHLATAATSNEYGAAIKAAVAIGKTTLNRYYDQTDHSELYRIAMSMDLTSVSTIANSHFSTASPPQASVLSKGWLECRVDQHRRKHPSYRV